MGRIATAVLALAMGAIVGCTSHAESDAEPASPALLVTPPIVSELTRPPSRVRAWPAMRAWMRGQSIDRAPRTRPTHSETDLARFGARVFELYCVNCHGKRGRGDGPRAPVFEPPPRDLARGIFKFRSTPPGSLPTREDLFGTITGGLYGTGMPAFADLPELHRWALVAYLRRLSPEFTRRADVDPLPIPAVPADLDRRAAVGGDVYRRVECDKCHGESGRGNGPAAATLIDEAGLAARTPDFALQRLKYGNLPEEIYRTLVTGLDGTPMPSYAGALTEEEVWDIVAFVRSLVGDTSSPRISARDVAEARAFVEAQQRQASHAVVGGCGCQARRR